MSGSLGGGTILNVFRNDAFTSVTLTEAVERNPYKPDGLGNLRLFEPKPIRTKALAVEQRQGRLVIIPTSARGAPPTERITEKRQARYFEAPRIATADTVYASELMDVREFGTESVMMQVQAEVARRLNGPTGLTSNIEYTWERHRLGAIQGLLLDADGTVLFNWFEEFGIDQPVEIGFNLAQANPPDGVLRTTCNQVVRGMTRAGQGAFTGRTKIVGLCGDDFWDFLVNHPDVTKTYYNWLQAAELRQGTAFRGTGDDANPFSANASMLTPMLFGDIYWINYRGSDDLVSVAIPSDRVKFFPQGGNDVFTVAWAPSDTAQWINKPGKPTYVLPIMDRDRQKWWRMEVESYPLHICTRPEVLFSGRAGA
jgi:Phage major capsid protein E